jgi:microsomal dipeptidase-like Zn-dependent dipeptidase
MRNGRWSKAMDYGEGSASNAGWPDALPWFSGSKGMENINNGLMRHGFSESEAGKILGENWFNFLKEGLEAKL